MKKTVLLSLAFVVAGLAVGCSDGGAASNIKNSADRPSMSAPGFPLNTNPGGKGGGAAGGDKK